MTLHPSLIRNLDELLSVDDPYRSVRSNLLEMVAAGVEAVMPENLMRNSIFLHDGFLKVKGVNAEASIELGRYRKIFVAGAGKASAGMARALVNIMGDLLASGWINSIEDGLIPLCSGEIVLNRASHPVPDMQGMEGTLRIRDVFGRAEENDLIIFLLSGGGSAMLPLPVSGLELEDVQQLTERLIRSGANIQEINCVRRHISAVKGGKLAAATGAEVLTLIISDVMGNQLESIASGPTAPDPTTYMEAKDIVEKYGLQHTLPPAILTALSPENETVKEGAPALERVHNIIIGDNRMAVKAMEIVAEKKNCTFQSYYELTGDVAEVARRLSEECTPTALYLGGGELTTRVRGGGIGGRSQEFLLSLYLSGFRGTAVSLGTDGIDGNSEAAGGIVDSVLMKRAEHLDLDAASFLGRNDSHRFLKSLGGAIFTGPTGTNVGDLFVLLPYP